ncbi:His Kinase A (phospho-acceptor) domain-containing protein [Xylanibacter ruminicola]|uniref:histidine kinase n=1 Tax=Xylanibacter ruminicola TaxID=839 RepID=A0A1H4CI26_XYLRU|nr:His Kinase A (phospho-acceptor) domain-containing protein [Xylanibacter ruminicola]
MSWQSIIFILILFLFAICLFLVQHYYHVRLRNEIGRAQRSERIKTVFMANVSHALRTPLNAIITDSQKLLDTEETNPKKLNAAMTTINQNGKQLLYFISQLLELSSFDSNMATFTMIEVNLAELMASYRREAQRDAGANVQVVVRSPLSPHAKGMVDTNLMYQLMTHLLHNALAHTQEGTITIDYDQEDKGLRIEVIDTGDGEPQDFQSNFSTLIQGNDSLALFNQRSGLGLSICKSIVEGLHGTIELKSEKGKGTHVTVWIPCKMRDTKKGLVR